MKLTARTTLLDSLIRTVWSLQSVAVLSHLSAAIWVVIFTWAGRPVVGALLAALFVLVAAGVLRLDRRRRQRAHADRQTRETQVSDREGAGSESTAARWFWHHPPAANQRLVTPEPDSVAPVPDSLVPAIENVSPATEALAPASEPVTSTAPLTPAIGPLASATQPLARPPKAPASAPDPLNAETHRLIAEARRLIEEIAITARTLTSLTNRNDSVGRVSRWKHALGELGEIDGLLLGYRLTIAWHRYRKGSAHDRLQDVVQRHMIASLSTARKRAYRAAALESPESDPVQTVDTRKAATLDLAFAERDIETCIARLEAGLAASFWDVYSRLISGHSDVEACDPSVLKAVFRTIDGATACAEGEDPMRTLIHSAGSTHP